MLTVSEATLGIASSSRYSPISPGLFFATQSRGAASAAAAAIRKSKTASHRISSPPARFLGGERPSLQPRKHQRLAGRARDHEQAEGEPQPVIAEWGADQ